MKIDYKPKTNLEIFGFNLLHLLVENFPSSFFVGGTVRNILLKKQVTDIDIATSARPEQVTELLKSYFVNYNLGYKNFGIVIATQNNYIATIATFRKESYSDSRYPKITYVKDPKTDSERRDFTINSFYLSPKLNKVLDYHNGLIDLKKKNINFIGDPKKRIFEDPLRIIRAIRFAADLNFKLSPKLKNLFITNFFLLENLGKNKLNSEINKIKNKKISNLTKKLSNDKIMFDKILKNL